MVVIVRYSEIGLKGKNRGLFEKKLVSNIEDCLVKNNIPYERVKRTSGRIMISTEQKPTCLKSVFGISSFSFAIVSRGDMNSFKRAANPLIEAVNKKKIKTFRISCQRVDKNFKSTSVEVEKELGAHVVEKTGLKVKLKYPDYTLGIEIIDKKGYIFSEKIHAFGGLPVGIEGKVLALIGDNSSLLAAILMLKRGCEVIPVTFAEKDKPDMGLLVKFSYGYNINIQKIKDISEIKALADELNARALVVNQTIKNISMLETDVPVLRPLAVLGIKDIEEKLNEFK